MEEEMGTLSSIQVSLVAQTVKNPPEMWEAWVRFLGWEDPLKQGKATHSSILAWRMPMDRAAWGKKLHATTTEPSVLRALVPQQRSCVLQLRPNVGKKKKTQCRASSVTQR
ncbi:unnamed protein product [Rangifer tarandus platyrhynchus]|uniref:Uncharacterized protein n=1 Tax=Rangifer tarandus platyrhynchus TaxID=3082113 RepID=A0AC59YZT9_RANTA